MASAGQNGEQLTPQELQIALLVTQGRTNAEVGRAVFLSTRTVEFHLSRAYRKLGVASRTELTQRLPRQDRSRADSQSAHTAARMQSRPADRCRDSNTHSRRAERRARTPIAAGNSSSERQRVRLAHAARQRHASNSGSWTAQHNHQSRRRLHRALLAPAPRLQRTFPQARFTGIIRRITDLDDRDYQRLVTTVTWLRANPVSGMLLRQLPIEGIDTKWLSSHAQLILALLGDSDHGPVPDSSQAVPAPGARRLHERLGLRVPPDLIQVAVLDPSLRAQLAGMRHLAASVEDLNRWEHRPDTVVILENKETGYAITDDHPGTVVLHGQGFSVACYARIGWVRTARIVIYWGDIDAPGLQFVNDLRGHGITVSTILMDTATLHRFRHLAADGAGPRGG